VAPRWIRVLGAPLCDSLTKDLLHVAKDNSWAKQGPCKKWQPRKLLRNRLRTKSCCGEEPAAKSRTCCGARQTENGKRLLDPAFRCGRNGWAHGLTKKQTKNLFDDIGRADHENAQEKGERIRT